MKGREASSLVYLSCHKVRGHRCCHLRLCGRLPFTSTIIPTPNIAVGVILGIVRAVAVSTVDLKESLADTDNEAAAVGIQETKKCVWNLVHCDSKRIGKRWRHGEREREGGVKDGNEETD